MADKAHQKVDKQIAELDKKLQQAYGQAEKELKAKMSEFTEKYIAKDEIWQEKLRAAFGTVSQEEFDKLDSEYENWKKGQVFQGKQWKAKVEEMSETLLHTNQLATKLVNGQLEDIFIGNANYSLYQLEHGAGVSFGFSMYDKATVARLIKEDPTLLPVKKVDAAADLAWNQKKITAAVTQGIIQGESLEEVAGRLTNVVGMNKNSALTNARTSMTGAQNAGRNQSLMDAKALGLNLVKEWMATLDERTRDSHRKMDGEQIKVGDKWHPQKFSNGLRYPADPEGPAWEVYNCRCTMVGDVIGFPSEYQRYDNIAGKPIKNMTYEQWAKAKGIQAKKKAAASGTGKLTKKETAQMAKAQAAVDSLKAQMSQMSADAGSYEGIWKDPVTLEDYESKQEKILDKQMYFMEQKAKDPTNPKWQELLDSLQDYDTKGKDYLKLKAEMQEQQKTVSTLKAKTLGSSAKFTQERKDAALWAKDTRDADKMLRGKCGEIWRSSPQSEKDAIYDYTGSYHKFNEPLRGIEYGTNVYKGVGNTDLNAGYANNGRRLNAMTSIIDKCSYDEDIWLQRGCWYDGIDKFFGVDMSVLKSGTQEELEAALLGTTPTEYAFMSCGTAKGKGFSDCPIIMNVYAPSGTKMMYVEPFSAFGHGSGHSWDGIATQSSFGQESEAILQQGTQFRITKVERAANGTLYLDLDVIGQGEPQLWTP